MHKLQRDCNRSPFCLVGADAGENIRSRLSSIGFAVVKLPPDPELSMQVCGHADLSLFFTGDAFVVRKKYADSNNIPGLLSAGGINFPIFYSEVPAAGYPDETALCAKFAGNRLVCRKESTDKNILQYASDKGYETVCVKQGYASCSFAVLADGALITGDPGIAAQALKFGIDTLKIRPGYITLNGYGSGHDGFIGGCSGLFGDRLFFTGNILLHPDGDKIAEFCERHATQVCCLSEGEAVDIGGLIFVR